VQFGKKKEKGNSRSNGCGSHYPTETYMGPKKKRTQAYPNDSDRRRDKEDKRISDGKMFYKKEKKKAV